MLPRIAELKRRKKKIWKKKDMEKSPSSDLQTEMGK